MTKRSFHRAVAAVLVLAVAFLMVVSLYSFVQNLGQGGPDQESPLTRIQNGNKVTKEQQDAYNAEQANPYLIFTGDHLALAKKTLDGTLRFEFPPIAEQSLVNTANKEKVFDCGGTPLYCTVKPKYASATFNLRVVTSTSEIGAESEYSKNVPLSVLSDSLLNRVDLPVTVPVAGFPELYPQDYYFFDINLGIYYPNGMAMQPDNGVNYAFEPGSVSESQVGKVRPLTDNKGKPVDGEYHVSFHRTSWSIFYTYGVAAIPLIFGLLFLHLLFFSRHFPHRIFEEFTEALIVAILAVLPLRVVLVPSELEGLTRVDLVLGIGLVAIVMVAVGKYANEIWTDHDHPEPHMHDHGMAQEEHPAPVV